MNRIAPYLLALLLLAQGCSSSTGGMKPSSDSDGGNSGGAGSNAGKNDSNSQQGKVSEHTIEIPVEQQRAENILLTKIEPRAVPHTFTVPGQIMMDEELTAHIASYPDGKVLEVLKLPGDRVQRGAVLARLHSHSVHESVGALAQAFADLERQKSAVLYETQKRDRYDHLFAIQAASLEQKQTSQQDLVQAQTNLANAQAVVHMEREHLGDLLQEPPASITPANLYTHELVPIKSPIAGTVISRSITPGAVLEPGVEAFTVSNLSRVWMIAQVNEADLADVRMDQHVNVRTKAWPDKNFPGRVTLIGSALDPTTRTVQVRVTIENPHGELKPLMFASATLDGTETKQAIFIPENALQVMDGVNVAFVTQDGTHFTPTALETLPPVNGQVEVTQGLKAGEVIATGGAFMLKSAVLKNSMGAE